MNDRARPIHMSKNLEKSLKKDLVSAPNCLFELLSSKTFSPEQMLQKMNESNSILKHNTNESVGSLFKSCLEEDTAGSVFDHVSKDNAQEHSLWVTQKYNISDQKRHLFVH